MIENVYSFIRCHILSPCKHRRASKPHSTDEDIQAQKEQSDLFQVTQLVNNDARGPPPPLQISGQYNPVGERKAEVGIVQSPGRPCGWPSLTTGYEHTPSLSMHLTPMHCCPSGLEFLSSISAQENCGSGKEGNLPEQQSEPSVPPGPRRGTIFS